MSNKLEYLRSTKSNGTNQSSPIHNGYSSAFKPTPSTTTTTTTSKSFVSLSDILNSSKGNSCLPVLSEPIPIIKPSFTSISPSIQDNKTTNLSLKDLVTVQELFKELELDCDEQIKQLDHSERLRKSQNNKQKEIVNEIKTIWKFKFKPSHIQSNLIPNIKKRHNSIIKTKNNQRVYRTNVFKRKRKKKNQKFIKNYYTIMLLNSNSIINKSNVFMSNNKINTTIDCDQNLLDISSPINIRLNLKSQTPKFRNNQNILDDYYEKYCRIEKAMTNESESTTSSPKSTIIMRRFSKQLKSLKIPEYPYKTNQHDRKV